MIREVIAEDDLALLAKSFEAAMEQSAGAAEVDAALYELGWTELLGAAPRQGAAATFALLGSTGSAATSLDDVLLSAFGCEVVLDTCVVLPRPHTADAPGTLTAGRLVGEGLVSARIDRAARVLVPAVGDDGVVLVEVAPAAIELGRGDALDPAGPFRRATFELDGVDASGATDWSRVAADARLALSHQLLGASRRMLELARTHAVDREQFGRPVASFQAVRHKLVDALVAIESAAAVADATVEDDGDELAATVAKSLAGRAARITATHAQQVLAGIGFTTEHPFHLYLKRTMVLDVLFGSARTLPVEIGRALLAHRGAPRLVEL